MISVEIFQYQDYNEGMEFFDFNPTVSRCLPVHVPFFQSIAFGDVIGSCSFFSTWGCDGQPVAKISKSTGDVGELWEGKEPLHSVSCALKQWVTEL